MDDALAFLIFISICLLLLFGGITGLEAWGCHSRWGASGMESSWGPVQGCLVKRPDGRWIPEERYREFKEDK